jgi:hypothetical protein
MEPQPQEGSWVDAYGISSPKKKAFLIAYTKCGTITKAAELIGIHRQTHTDWSKREHDEREAYCAAFAEAEERCVEGLENELYRRAYSGSSDSMSGTLLIFTLKAKRPLVYRDRIHVDSNTGGKAEVSNVDLSKLNDEQLTQLKGLLGLMSGSVQST